MTHTLNRRSRRPDGPQAADGAAPPNPFIPGLARGAGPVGRAGGACTWRRAGASGSGPRGQLPHPAGPLAEALPRFADAAGVTVLFDAALLGARGTGGLNGSYSVSEGFARLLAGSGLAARERSAGIYVLVPRMA